MTLYAGLDVGDKATHLCVVDGEGGILWRGACATDPEALAFTLKKHAPGLARVVLETGALSAFLYHGLTRARRAGGVHLRAPCQGRAVGARQTRATRTMPWGWRTSRARVGSSGSISRTVPRISTGPGSRCASS